MTAELLFGMHATLFPSGRKWIHKISVGAWRDNEKGLMQIVSGPMDIGGLLKV